MGDEIDRAQEREEEMRQDAWARHARMMRPVASDSAQECALCDEPIPEGRRQAVPGVQLCVDCQGFVERTAFPGGVR